ncbi:hypothetical protein NQZ68_020199, partial [Dissostichus eleginoides]
MGLKLALSSGERQGCVPFSERLRRAQPYRQQLDSWGRDHKEPETQTEGSYVSVVKRNQTVLSYAHAGVSENTATHSPDEMRAHTHNPSHPYHSRCVINRQRKWRCWGGGRETGRQAGRRGWTGERRQIDGEEGRAEQEDGVCPVGGCRCVLGWAQREDAAMGDPGGSTPLCSMSHEPKSPSLGMISTATRTTATVSPLTPSPLNGSIVANGSPAAQSAHSGFAAALRKLAKQAEEPRDGPFILPCLCSSLLCLYMEKEEMGGEGAASSISSESSPVSSPATNHSSPVSTPKRGPLGQGPVLVPPPGHSVPNTPPVVTIAPTKTSNGLWRSEGRQNPLTTVSFSPPPLLHELNNASCHWDIEVTASTAANICAPPAPLPLSPLALGPALPETPAFSLLSPPLLTSSLTLFTRAVKCILRLVTLTPGKCYVLRTALGNIRKPLRHFDSSLEKKRRGIAKVDNPSDPIPCSVSFYENDPFHSSRVNPELEGARETRETADSVPRGASRERLGAEGNHPQEKGGPSVPAHLLGNPYAFGLSPGAVMQDSRFQPLNMARQMSNAVPPGHVPEEYLRGFRPYATTEDALRMPSLPMGLDPATAAAAAAYYHPSYLPHPSFTPYRVLYRSDNPVVIHRKHQQQKMMDDPFCLSAMRSPFYQLPGGGALPPMHPSVHMHLQGVRYPGDFTHPSLSALQSE